MTQSDVDKDGRRDRERGRGWRRRDEERGREGERERGTEGQRERGTRKGIDRETEGQTKRLWKREIGIKRGMETRKQRDKEAE